MSAAPSTRVVCTGDAFAHAPTIMSIARSKAAAVELRCPICRDERSVPNTKPLAD